MSEHTNIYEYIVENVYDWEKGDVHLGKVIFFQGNTKPLKENHDYYFGFQSFIQILNYEGPLTFIAAVADDNYNDNLIKKGNNYHLHLCDHSGNQKIANFCEVVEKDKDIDYLRLKIITDMSTIGLHKYGVIDDIVKCKAKLFYKPDKTKINRGSCLITSESWKKIKNKPKKGEKISLSSIHLSNKCVKDPIITPKKKQYKLIDKFQLMSILIGFGIIYISTKLSRIGSQ